MGTAVAGTLILDLSPWTCEEWMDVCGFSHTVCGILLRQPGLTKTEKEGCQPKSRAREARNTSSC